MVEIKLERLDLDIALREQRERTVREVALLASRIEAEINSTFYLVAGLARLIEINGGITELQYQEICEQLVKSRPGLRNIAAAPDMIVRYIYPLEGNEAAMGLDYTKHPTQRGAAFQVKESGKPLIAGPINLVQGGEAIVGRFPTYVRDPNTGEKVFWGLISTPFDTTTLYKETGLLDPALNVDISLRGKNALGAKGEIFWGSETIYKNEYISFPIELLTGSWEMAAIPKGGWLKESPKAWAIRILCGALTLSILLVVWLYYLYLLKVQRSRETEREVSRIKERFYANMSHELRTPLNAIYGMSELIKVSTTESEVENHASMILRSAEALTRLLDDVLILSRDDTPQATNRQIIELEPFLHDILPPLSYEATRKRIKLTIDPVPAECARIQTNPAMLRQILWNLLSNAVKFTHVGSVSLHVAMRPDRTISFMISDTGVGIAPDRLENIFEAFVQEDDSDTRQYGGAGLGLAIVQRFVEQLGGDVSVQSQKDNGSTFTVTLRNAAVVF